MTEHQSSFPSRQVHLISTSGIPSNNGSTKADLMFYFNTPVVYIPSSYDCVLSCISASIPYIWTNITSDNNTISVANQSVSLPIGNYNITDIMDYLNKHITNITFSYSATTNLVTATSTSAGFTFTDNSLSNFLGFTTKSSSTLILVATVPINLIKTTSVYVECPELLNESFDSRINGQSGVICRIPVVGSPGNLISWTNIFGTHTKLSVKHINHIRVRLLDDQRNILDLRGFTWTVTLQFNIVESVDFVEGAWLESSRTAL